MAPASEPEPSVVRRQVLLQESPALQLQVSAESLA